MTMTNRQVLALVDASVLIGRHFVELSPFELETLADAGKRFLDHGREAVITEAEWEVIDRSVEAMRKAAEQPNVRRISA